MKLKLNLSPGPKPAQWATLQSPAGAGARKISAFDLLARPATRSVRIPVPLIGARPTFRGRQVFRKSWRSAELTTWQAELNFPAF